MGKKQDFALSPWITDYVLSVIRGYSDREKYLAKYASYGNKVANLYRSLNKAIDDALSSVCLECEEKPIRSSLFDSIPYEYICNYPGNRSSFYLTRKKVVFTVAKNLHII